MAANRYSVIFAAALVVAAGATYFVFRTIEATRESGRVPMQAVVVASRNIDPGTPIDRLAIKTESWPAAAVPPGGLTEVDSVVGRIAKVSIFTGEAIVPGRLAAQGSGAGLEVLLAPGKRAMGVRVNDVSSIAGMIQPNSRVDILLTLNRDDGNGRVAKLFMSNMRVLAMGTQSQRAEDGRPIVTTVATLEVTPQEAERLGAAQVQGQIQLVLRGYGEPDTARTAGASTAELVGAQAPIAAAVRLPEKAIIPRSARRFIEQPSTGPVAAPAAPSPAVASAVPPARPDSFTIRVLRGRNTEEKRFAKDSAKRDSTP